MVDVVAIIKSEHQTKSYRIYGRYGKGFGIEVIWRREDGEVEEARTPCLFGYTRALIQMVHSLAREQVHPLHLLDITENWVVEMLYEGRFYKNIHPDFPIDKPGRDCYTDNTTSCVAAVPDIEGTGFVSFNK